MRWTNRQTLASEQATGEGREVELELAHDLEKAMLLAEMHRLHTIEGRPFEQAWREAQENSGVRLDIDAIVERLLGEQIAPMENVVRFPIDQISEKAENIRKVQGLGAGHGVPGAMDTIGDSIEAHKERIGEKGLPETSDEHYKEDRAIERVVHGPDGEIMMVVPDKSLLMMGNERVNEMFFHMIGAGDSEEKDETAPSGMPEAAKNKDDGPMP